MYVSVDLCGMPGSLKVLTFPTGKYLDLPVLTCMVCFYNLYAVSEFPDSVSFGKSPSQLCELVSSWRHSTRKSHLMKTALFWLVVCRDLSPSSHGDQWWHILSVLTLTNTIKHSDKSHLGERWFILTYRSGGYHPHGREDTAVGSGVWRVKEKLACHVPSTRSKQRVNVKYSGTIKHHCLSPGTDFFHQGAAWQRFHSLPRCTTRWWPSVQKHVPLGGISYSNQNRKKS